MDKTAWIVVILCSLGLLWWCDGQRKYAEELDRARKAAAEKKAAEAAENPESGDPDSGDTTPEGSEPTTTPPPERKEETLSNESAHWVFSNYGGGLSHAVLKEHDLKRHAKDDETPESEREKVTMNRYASMPIGALSRGHSQFEGLTYQVLSKSEEQIVMQAQTPAGLQVTKTFDLTGTDAPGDGYIVKLNLNMKYVGESGNFSGSGYFVYMGSAAPLYPGESGFNVGVHYLRKGKDKFRQSSYFKKASRVNFTKDMESLLWGGTENQFFTLNLCAEAPSEGSLPLWAGRFPVKLVGYENQSEGVYGVHGAMGLPDFTLNPGEEKSWNYEIYAGPKHFPTLRQLDRRRSELTGFDRVPILGWMAEPFSKMLSSLMSWLYGILGNYGWAIIVITVIIRLAIWPLHIKSQRTMKRMSLLQPKMAELKEKYPDNPQKMNQEMMGMYRDYGINPLGGCLPILLQMPIFLGFFSMLRSAVKLRHEPWLAWVNDLSMPDTVVYILGFPLNPLPLLMAVTMVLQMRMTPMTGDKMQRRIFMFMPVIFLVFCYNFASALALYWTAQNVISMGQTWLLRNQKDPVLVKRKRPTRPDPRKGGMPSFGPPAQKKSPKRKQIRTGGGKRKRN